MRGFLIIVKLHGIDICLGQLIIIFNLKTTLIGLDYLLGDIACDIQRTSGVYFVLCALTCFQVQMAITGE